MVVFFTNLSVLYTGDKKRKEKKKRRRSSASAICSSWSSGSFMSKPWSELDSERRKYWEIGGSDAESGMILAKGGPVYSCYCYGGDELIWYLALINDEGLCGLNLKAASGRVFMLLDCISPAHILHTCLTTVLQLQVFILKMLCLLFCIISYCSTI